MLSNVTRNPRELYRTRSTVLTVDDDLGAAGFTKAQDAVVKQRVADPEFALAVTLLLTDEELNDLRNKPGPRGFLYYTKDGALRILRLGVKGRVLAEAVA